METAPTPGFCVSIGTHHPDINQEDIDKQRKERMDRQATKQLAKKKKVTVKLTTPVMAGFTFRPKKKAREELMTLEEMRRLRE